MRTLFHGCRRMAGVAMLVAACLLASAWVRSLRHEDILSINVFPQQIAVDSISGRLHVVRYENFVIWAQRGMAPISLFQWETLDVLEGEPAVSDRILNAASMSFTNYGQDSVSHTLLKCVIPYWSVTIPLTLLSAYLILWKPRKRAATRPSN